MSTLCALNVDYTTVKTILQFLSCNVVEYDSQAIINYSRVSKLWRRIILDELNWHTLFRASFEGKANAVQGFTAKLVDIIGEHSWYHHACVFRIKVDMSNNSKCANTIQWENIYTHESPNSEHLQEFMTFFQSSEMNKPEGLWRNSIVVSPAKSNTLELICQINVSVVKKIMKSGENLSTAFLSSSLELQFAPPRTPFEPHPCLPLSVKLLPAVQPKGFVSGFLMSDYQLSTLNWLLRIENRQKERQCYANITSWYTETGKFYIGKENFVNPLELDSYEKVNYTAKGGLLFYFKHLGRRVEIISLILSTLNKYEIPILEKDLTPTGATLIMCGGLDAAKKWQQEIAQITSPKLKVLVLDGYETVARDLVVNADVVIGYNGKTAKGHNKKTIDQFIWTRVVFEYLPNSEFVTNLHAKNWWIVLCSSSYDYDYPVIRDIMTQLGFPPQTVSEFLTKYVWATYIPRNSSVDRHSSFRVEDHPIPLTGVELYHYIAAQKTKTPNQIFCVNTTLDEEKKRIIPSEEAAVMKCFDRIEQNPGLIADVIQHLWRYASIAQAPDVYDGPQTSVAEVMHRVSDALLAQQISEKGDINETQDVYKYEIPTKILPPQLGERPRSFTMQEKEMAKESSKIRKFSFRSIFLARRFTSWQEPSKNQLKQNNQNNKVTSPRNTMPPNSKLQDETNIVIGSQKEKPVYKEIEKRYILPFLTNEFGSLIGHLLRYLRDLWIRDPSARVLVFTSIQPQLRKIYTALDRAGIATGIISNRFAGRRVAVGESTTNEHPLRVFLTDHVLHETVSFAVSHIFFLSCTWPENIKKLYSSCYPQGQRKALVAVTYFWKDTEDHIEYYKHQMTTVPVHCNRLTEKLKPISSKSAIGSLIVNAGLEQYSQTIRKLIN